MFQPFESFLKQARIGESRSSVINPLQWTLVIGFAALFFFVMAKSPPWLLISTAVATGADFLLLLCAYGYFAVKDPDALRSEQYSLVKTAIEKRLLGDSITGLIEVTPPDADSTGKTI